MATLTGHSVSKSGTTTRFNRTNRTSDAYQLLRRHSWTKGLSQGLESTEPLAGSLLRIRQGHVVNLASHEGDGLVRSRARRGVARQGRAAERIPPSRRCAYGTRGDWPCCCSRDVVLPPCRQASLVHRIRMLRCCLVGVDPAWGRRVAGTAGTGGDHDEYARVVSRSADSVAHQLRRELAVGRVVGGRRVLDRNGQYRQWLGEAGFAQVERVLMANNMSLIRAFKT